MTEKTKRLYLLRIRKPDGTWVWDTDNLMTKREANKKAKFARIMGGIVSQIWTEEEARAVLAKIEE